MGYPKNSKEYFEMADKTLQRLFFLDSECPSCPVAEFNLVEEDWFVSELTENEIPNGSHVIKDGTEMIKTGSNMFRELKRGEEELWDLSTPDETEIDRD